MATPLGTKPRITSFEIETFNFIDLQILRSIRSSSSLKTLWFINYPQMSCFVLLRNVWVSSCYKRLISHLPSFSWKLLRLVSIVYVPTLKHSNRVCPTPSFDYPTIVAFDVAKNMRGLLSWRSLEIGWIIIVCVRLWIGALYWNHLIFVGAIRRIFKKKIETKIQHAEVCERSQRIYI